MTHPDPLLEVFGFGALWRLRGQASVVAQESESKHAVSADHAIQQPLTDERLIESDLVQTVVKQVPSDLSVLNMAALRERVVTCTLCQLCETRTHAVFGVGDPDADWLFVGEGPGMNEDQQGEPFVGQAGKLLDNMLVALGLQRDAGVFIANVVKCRPPGNRDPLPDEVAACAPYLRRQIALIQPKVIVALGRFAAQTLLGTDAKIGSLRGTVHHYEGLPVVVTYHPAYLLRALSDKAKAWQDLCLARTALRALSTNTRDSNDAINNTAAASVAAKASATDVDTRKATLPRDLPAVGV